jgi:hypothetical protein
MKTEDRYVEIVSGNVYEEISVNLGRKKLLLRPIFIENDGGERDVLCYVPQDLQPKDNEPFTQMVCDLLRTGMQEAFPYRRSVCHYCVKAVVTSENGSKAN